MTASREQLKIFDYVNAPIQVVDLTIEHNLIIVVNLITAVILSIDFI